MKSESYWKNIQTDIRRYRKAEVSREYMARTYPELHVEKRQGRWTAIQDAMNIVIPEDCPLVYVARIAFATEGEPFDTNQVSFDIIFSYQPIWESLPKTGKMVEICKEKSPLQFDSWVEKYNVVDKPYIDIRYLLEYGSYGDSDGYGIEPDVWLSAKLLKNGTWLEDWHVEDYR